jgi:uncharacterized phiE125 gp8 family phage protein
MSMRIYTEPTEEPLLLDDTLKKHLRVEDSEDDDLIAQYIRASRLHCENFQGRKYITQTWDLYLDAFPSTGYIEIPMPPLQSVTTLKYKDSSGTLQTWTSTNYIVDVVSEPGRIALAYGISWPTTYSEVQAVQIRFVCGYGLSASVPTHIKQAMMLKLADLWENRGDSENQFVTDTKSQALESLLWPDRIVAV